MRPGSANLKRNTQGAELHPMQVDETISNFPKEVFTMLPENLV